MHNRKCCYHFWVAKIVVCKQVQLYFPYICYIPSTNIKTKPCSPNVALRTLGIPARPITNFSSAHDADANRAIDHYFDERGRPLDMSSDSVWLANDVLCDVVLYAM